MDSILNFDYITFFSNAFSNLNFETIMKLWIVYFFVLWIAIIIWVTKDIINRTNNVFFQLISILIVLFWTPLWVIVYLLIRPSQTLFEKLYEEDLIEDDNQPKEEQIIKISCPSCSYIINSEYKFCPNCRTKLKNECISCHKELKPEWTLCPYCGVDQNQKVETILKPETQSQENKEWFEHIDILTNKELIIENNNEVSIENNISNEQK